VYFGFDKSLLTTEAKDTLKKSDDCLKRTNDPLTLIGHADPRGTTEYNMALSDHRARAVKDYLKRLGIKPSRLRTVPRGALDATGTDEAGWARDRRVDSEWR
jgi:peptidoglycan-associated lipoprotein